ncbi:hypothetical protein MMC34_003361 [Xylographa carneopallida]|nr:hypothetical protein [Xylographa carneopallida]
MRVLTVFLAIAILNLNPAFCLISCNGFPLTAALTAAQIESCHRAIAGIPAWSIDVGHTGANGRGSIILHPQVQHYRAPASFEHNDPQNLVRCGVQISALETHMIDGQPHSTGIPVVLSVQALAFYVWNAAQHAAGRVVDECLRAQQRLGMSTEFVRIPGTPNAPEMLVEINVMVKVESFAFLYQV